MGLFGTFRYHEPWEPVNEAIVAQHGLPVRSLYMDSEKIVDSGDRVLYRVRRKILSLHGKTDIYDNTTAQLVAHYERVVLSLHYRYCVQMNDGATPELYSSNDVIEIVPLGWIVRMEGFARNCTLFDAEGRILAFIGRKNWSMHNRYSIDIYAPEAEQYIVTIASVIQSMFDDATSNCGE